MNSFLCVLSFVIAFSELCECATDAPCTSSGGVCQYTSTACSYVYVTGLCSGPTDRKCCINDRACLNVGGTCQSTTIACSGDYRTGLCAGPSSRRCCVKTSAPPPVPPPTNTGDLKCTGAGGVCQVTSTPCSYIYVTGLCSGPTDRKCCINDRACANVAGTCQSSSTSPCTGGAYRTGLCAGPTDRKCCVKTSGPGPVPPPTSNGCIARICSSYATNLLRGVDKTYGSGAFGASRDNGARTHNGVDVKCNANADVYAPFDGKITREAKPYTTNKCCNRGVEIVGSGDWSGYTAKMFYVISSSIGQTVKRGQVIGRHVSLHCSTCYTTDMTDHVHFELYKNGVLQNPTSKVAC